MTDLIPKARAKLKAINHFLKLISYTHFKSRIGDLTKSSLQFFWSLKQAMWIHMVDGKDQKREDDEKVKTQYLIWFPYNATFFWKWPIEKPFFHFNSFCLTGYFIHIVITHVFSKKYLRLIKKNLLALWRLWKKRWGRQLMMRPSSKFCVRVFRKSYLCHLSPAA